MFNRFKKNESGQSIVLVALMMTVLLGFGALTVDIGRITYEKSVMQNAVDAASLAAVQSLPNTTAATTVANTTFMDNSITTNRKTKMAISDIDFSVANKVKITAHETVEYSIAQIFKNGNSKVVNVVAAAAITTPLDDLDHALFSGSTLDWLQFTASSTEITGDVHSNQDIKGEATVHGEATVAGEFKDNKLTASGGKQTLSNPLNMPSLSPSQLAELKAIAIAAGTYYSGNTTFSADSLNTALSKGSIIYVDGNVDTNGSGVNAKAGSIIATGDITFDGSKVTLNSNSPICFYSATGDVILNGGSSALHGIIWAPNGSAEFNGQGGVLNGRIYGNEIKLSGAINVSASTNSNLDMKIKTISLVE